MKAMETLVLLGAPSSRGSHRIGRHDINLTWTAEDNDGSAPKLFTAIQEQLSLKLESGKKVPEMLLIDHADRDPGQNQVLPQCSALFRAAPRKGASAA